MKIQPARSVTTSRPILEVRNVVKKFGDVAAVGGVSFSVWPGEFFTLLGPSGSGKTTILRIIGGLERPDQGEVYLEDQLIVAPERGIFVPPERRNMGMVFQSYAVWPHMTVFENIAYPLRLRKAPPHVIQEKVQEVLRLVQIEGLARRSALLLSGGEQQRVVLARALVYSPKVLLLDEPLSNLDAKLREQMRLELKILQRRVGFTAVFVTHDQLEAMALSDRVMIMKGGQCEQSGSPQGVYDVPSSAFVRDFVGRTVRLRGMARKRLDNDRLEVELPDGSGAVLGMPGHRLQTEAGAAVVIAMRAEDISVSVTPDDQRISTEAEVEALVFLGREYECQLRIGDQSVNVFTPRSLSLTAGQRVYMVWDPSRATLWPA